MSKAPDVCAQTPQKGSVRQNLLSISFQIANFRIDISRSTREESWESEVGKKTTSRLNDFAIVIGLILEMKSNSKSLQYEDGLQHNNTQKYCESRYIVTS